MPSARLFRRRRGSAIILLAAALTLLTLLAVLFLQRTSAGRDLARSGQRSAQQREHAHLVARMLANEIGGALFVRPLETVPATGVASANAPRLDPAPEDLVYGVDRRAPYNRAPRKVMPGTNWPDDDSRGAPWPRGEGAIDGIAGLGTSNPVGGPRFGDTPWLRSLEPVRWDSSGNGIDDAFAFWAHLSNLARAGNGWRQWRDISDLDGAGVIEDLDVPTEQWLVSRPPFAWNFSPITGDAIFIDAATFELQWNAWFDQYAEAYLGGRPGGVPPNFYNLKDLNGNGIIHEPGEQPEDEFIPGTPRWHVTRRLVDTDGDGFTDAFWFLAPIDSTDGTRALVAVSITDNCGRFPAAHATRFAPGPHPTVTVGETPADLAAWGGGVGYFDEPRHAEAAFDVPAGLLGAGPFPLYDRGGNTGAQIGWDQARWADHLAVLGVGADGGPPADPNGPWTARQRRYFRLGIIGHPNVHSRIAPFSIENEMELRLRHGQNAPRTLTPFERGVNGGQITTNAFLRSATAFEETSEYLGQLSNAELLRDHRRKITLASAARNDRLPSWLRWRWTDDEATPVREDLPSALRSAGPDSAEAFIARSARKLDLREGRGTLTPPGALTMPERLPQVMLHVLSDGDDLGGTWYGDALGPAYGPADADRVRRLAASFSANVLAYRDSDDDAPIQDAVPLPEWGGLAEDADSRFLGLERQPFLVEAFVGHVSSATGIITINTPGLPPFDGEGQGFVDASSPQTTIVAIQLANPFRAHGSAGIDLSSYRLRVAGHDVTLAGVLPAATTSAPATAVVTSIPNSFAGEAAFRDRWLDYLDLDANDLAPGSIVMDVASLPGAWPTDRSALDAGAAPIVELLRVDPVTGAAVVVDRLDDGRTDGVFRTALRDLPALPAPLVDPAIGRWAGIRLGVGDHWSTWTRVTRAWGFDADFDPADTSTHGMQSDEDAPRFVFAREFVTTSDETQSDDRGLDGGAVAGSAWTFTDDPDEPWFDRASAPGRRKPTCFNMHPVFDAGADLYPSFTDPAYGFGRFVAGTSYPPGTAPGAGVPDKLLPAGEAFFPHALQMLQKDADFQQIGELLHVWKWGHEIDSDPLAPITRRTFSEAMRDELASGSHAVAVNRLALGHDLGVGDALDPFDPLHAVPAMPAVARLFEAVVCDGPGANHDPALPAGTNVLANAMGYDGRGTPGLININTASVEVLRPLPHFSRMMPVNPAVGAAPRSALPEAIVTNRGSGYASIGELLGVRTAPAAPTADDLGESIAPSAWTITGAADDPFAAGLGAPLSTDVVGPFTAADPRAGDGVSRDREEENLLFAGASNLLTTTSDTYTVHFRIRRIRYDETRNVWDATSREHIVEDKRFVMLVDRSRVERPTDRARIVYLEETM